MLKRSFTLIEMLLVILLIGLTFGMVAFRVPHALNGEKFERAVDKVKSRILLAQEVMLDFQTDVSLSFVKEEKGFSCCIMAQKPLPKSVEREMNRHHWIEGIEEMVFERTPVNQVVLEFDSTLGATPQGKLVLIGIKREVVLSLKGFPSSILRGDHVVAEIEAHYPEAILSFI